MRKKNKLEVSGQFLYCPLMLSIDTYEGCLHECRYCFARTQYERQNRGKSCRESIRPALLTQWERALKGESIRNPMIEYLIKKKHPIQLGTKADPFPEGVELLEKNTRKFIELCNLENYPVYICTKNTDVSSMPIDLLARGNYILGVSLASNKPRHIKMLEGNTTAPLKRLQQIPKGVFKKIVIKWHPFIPQLFQAGAKRGEKINWNALTGYLDAIAGFADAVSISFLAYEKVWDSSVFQQIGPDVFSELEELAILTYIKEQAHQRHLEFYTANYGALSDSPICCGIRLQEPSFAMSSPWVWGSLVWKLYSGEKEYLTQEDIIAAFPEELKEIKYATMNIPPFSRWAHYTAHKYTILEEYIRNFTFNRKKNPANFYAGVYSRVVDGQFRVYFKEYRDMVAP